MSKISLNRRLQIKSSSSLLTINDRLALSLFLLSRPFSWRPPQLHSFAARTGKKKGHVKRKVDRQPQGYRGCKGGGLQGRIRLLGHLPFN